MAKRVSNSRRTRQREVRASGPHQGGSLGKAFRLRLSDGATIGVLWLRVPAIEIKFSTYLRDFASDDFDVADAAHELAIRFMRDLAAVAQRRIEVGIPMSALGFVMIRLEHHSRFVPQEMLDHALSLLHELVSRWHVPLPELLSMPPTQLVRQHVRRYGTEAQKETLSKLLTPTTRAKAGRPRKRPEDRADSVIRKEVDAACVELESAFQRKQEILASGGDDNDVQNGLANMPRDQRQAIVKGRDLQDAARRLVAARRGKTLASIRTMDARAAD